MKNFALMGAAGYIAPRHLKAIRDTGGQLVAAFDPHDSVGILDSWFPDAKFFTEFERFDRHLEKMRRQGEPVNYVAIASPNYLHDAHCRFALRIGADAICEKPLVINPWNLDALVDLEAEHGKRIYSVLQLRLHPAVMALRERVRTRMATEPKHRFQVSLDYVTSRGAWYFNSWKGDDARSGGIVTNIGVHFFDMLQWIFGEVSSQGVEALDADRARGTIAFAHADAAWRMSINADDLPAAVVDTGQRTYRNISVDGEEVEFSGGFTDLHTQTYQQILAGAGFGIADARPSIALVHAIREMAR